MSPDTLSWTVSLGMGLLLLTPSVVLTAFAMLQHPNRNWSKPARRGFAVVRPEEQQRPQ